MQRALLFQIGQHDAGPLGRLVDDVLLAEELGIETVWCLPEAGEAGDFRLGAPEYWLAALAARTERIRLGWGLAGLTPPERAPIRTAERAASLDLACDGRLDLALFPAAEPVPTADAPEGPRLESDWDEGLRMLVDMWDAPRFSWTSARFEVPPLDVVPKPVQKPHPPVSLLGWSAEQAREAGRAGLGFLDVSGGVDDALEMHRDAYVEARATADPNELVCVSRYAAALGADRPTDLLSRLEVWERLGFDQAVLRIDANEDEPQRIRAWIRVLAGQVGETGEVH